MIGNMVEIQPRGNAFGLVFSEAECMRLGLDKAKEYELTKAGNGIWVLVEGNIVSGKQVTVQRLAMAQQANRGSGQTIDETEQKIIGYLYNWQLKDRVQGIFEKKLSGAELKKFGEMLSKDKVWVFKLNEKYRKAIYKPMAEKEKAKNQAKFENREKPIEEYTIENDGFLVVKNEMRAKAISEEYQEKIKGGEIKGIRSFSGEFFIIRTDLLVSSQEKVLLALRGTKSAELAALSEKTGFTPTLVRIAMEFLKEEGQVIEKRKGYYQYIE